MKIILINAAVVGSGGFLGAVARYGLSGMAHRQLPLSTFPIGTLLVNAIGCFLIGLLAGFVESRQLFGVELRTFALVGLLGGFTTFSTFGFETFTMLRDAEHVRALLNVGLNVILGVVLVWLGYMIAAWEVG